MFKKLLFLFSIVIAAAAAASWLAGQPGAVQIEWLGWRMELPTSLAVALIVIFALVLVFFDRLLRAIRAMPRWIGGRLRQRRDDAGHRALALGLMAVSAGEPAEARKHASRAERLLKEPKLTSLLVAQAAHLAGDHQAARRYFTSILDDRETAFLGHIGLMRLALDDHDPVKARQSAKAALALKPNSVLAANHLFKLETGRNDWNAALPALDVIARQQKKTKSKTAPDQLALIARQGCALHFLKADELQESDRKSADKELLAALKIDPGFLPAVNMLADHYLDNKAHGGAAKILETAFKIHPHDSIAARLKAAWKSNDGQFIAKLTKLLAQMELNQQKAAYFLVAKQARNAGLDGEADRLFSAARDLDGDDKDAQSLWHCTSCKSKHDDWQAFCPACDEFAAMVWQRPAGTSPLIKHNS
jgi:HemY protein